MTEDTEYLLSQWALWTRVNDGWVRGYPKRSPFSAVSSCSDLAITDDQAMTIDAAVKRLLERDKTIGRATMLYFFYRQNNSRVAEKMKTSRRTTQSWISSGIAWVDGALSPVEFFAGKGIADQL